MPEYDALHTDAHRINAFAAGHVFTAVELNKLHYAPPGTENGIAKRHSRFVLREFWKESSIRK